MTVYRTIAFDQNTMAYHGGDSGWIRHANTGNLSRPSLEPDLSDLTLVRPVRLGRFGRRLGRARHAPNVLGDLPLVHPVGTDRFGNRIQVTRYASNVLGLDPGIVADIAQGVEAAAAVGATAYALDEQHKATKDAKAQAAADTAAANAATAATAAAAQAAATPASAAADAGKGAGSSKILLYAVGGLAALAVLMLLTRRSSAPAPAPVAAKA